MAASTAAHTRESTLGSRVARCKRSDKPADGKATRWRHTQRPWSGQSHNGAPPTSLGLRPKKMQDKVRHESQQLCNLDGQQTVLPGVHEQLLCQGAGRGTRPRDKAAVEVNM